MAKTIIVPLDGTEFAKRALAPAHALARQADAAVVLVMARAGGVVDPERYLRRVADEYGIGSAHIAVFEDRPADAAIAETLERAPDPIVCMTTHARGAVGHLVLGSVAEHVLRRTDTPIVLVGPAVDDDTPSDFEELIVCLDGSPTAATILPTAAGLAHDLELVVALVDVVESDASADYDAALDADALESSCLQQSAKELIGTGLNVSWYTLHGNDAPSAIVDFADTRPSPLLAMTTHGRTGLARVATGSVVMAVVHRAPCPVLVTRSVDLAGSDE